MRKVIVSGLSCLAAAVTTGCATSEPKTPNVSPNNTSPPQWQTVWFDDFDGTELNRQKWNVEESCWGGGNNERQCYTDRPENIVVEDGILRLIARPETYTGWLQPFTGPGGERRTQEYTSGKVVTRGTAVWRYGRFSARMKLPAGQGTWPAFWMMPHDSFYGKWPLSGELDIMEAVNLETPCPDCPNGYENRTSGALHFGDLPPDNTYLFLKTEGVDPASPADEWRVYSVEWAQDEIQWFVDGQIFMRIKADDWHSASRKAKGREFAPFDQPFYLMINLAVGGNLPEKSNGAGFDPNSFPAELLVDWVRVEQCLGDQETGRACLSEQEWTGKPEGPWETQAR